MSVLRYRWSTHAIALMLTPDPVDRDWQDAALCAQVDPEAFFPERGESSKEAKKVCMACEVRAQCLEYALDHDEQHGIWGGTSERERRKLRRERRGHDPAA